MSTATPRNRPAAESAPEVGSQQTESGLHKATAPSLRQGLSRLADIRLVLRDRMLSSPRFQRWAARFPLTRPTATRRMSSLFDLCAGFVYSQVLRACVEVNLLETLADAPAPASTLATKLGLTESATLRLLEAACSLRLVERRRGELFGLGIHGASYVGNPLVRRMVTHHALLYRDLADPVALLRGETPETELERFWAYPAREPQALRRGEIEAYSALMAGSLSLIAEDVLEAYPLRRHRHLMDVGGGVGAFLASVAARAPRLELTLVDLPAVVEHAAPYLRAEGLERVRRIGIDVHTHPLPRDADLISLVRVLHDHDDAQALALLRACRRALPRGGTLLVTEPMSETPRAEPMGAAYFGFYLLAMGQGRPRSARHIEAMMREAGFSRVRRRRSRRPMLAQLLVGHA